MTTIIASDVHIGSGFFLAEPFAAFLRGLPPDARLVLNGDTVDYRHTGANCEREAALDLLRAESRRREVVWVYGNHDDGYVMESPAHIRFVSHFAIDHRLCVAHGHDFDNVMPYHRAFIRLFRLMHHLRMRLGCEAVHVAQYAKKWKRLYAILRRNVLMNAVEYARENGFSAVACGHTHFPEEHLVDGIRYFNTGSWTERPMYYVRVTDDAITLELAEGKDAAAGSVSTFV